MAASATATYLASRLHTPVNLHAATVHGYTVGFLVSAVFLAIAALSAALLMNARRADIAAMSESATLEAESLGWDTDEGELAEPIGAGV